MTYIHRQKKHYPNVPAAAAAAAAAAVIFAVLPLLWKGLVVGAARATPVTTNGLVDWAAERRY